MVNKTQQRQLPIRYVGGFSSWLFQLDFLSRHKQNYATPKTNLHLSEVFSTQEAKLQSLMQLQDHEQINKISVTKQTLIYCFSFPYN